MKKFIGSLKRNKWFKLPLTILVCLYFLSIPSCQKDEFYDFWLSHSYKQNKPGGKVQDIEGTWYKTVKIGDQWWMAENLKVTRYNDETSIANVTNISEWSTLATGAYCWYENDPSYKNLYGALYNWYAVNTDKLCPAGWHVPTDAEWTALIDYLGGENIAGGKLKERGTTHWIRPNIGANNISGFTALPGGSRGYLGSFYFIGYYGHWWTATEYESSLALNRHMYHGDNNVESVGDDERVGLSVRCLKDN